MKPVFIDIGGHLGEELTPALRDGFEVHCFEPNGIPNAPTGPDVVINTAAAWNMDGEAPLYGRKEGDSSNMSCSLIKEKTNVDKERFTMVPTINLGQYLNNLDRDIDILKVDCEGAEYYILESILNHFDPKRIKGWYVEDHEVWIPSDVWLEDKHRVLGRLTEVGITLKPWISYGNW